MMRFRGKLIIILLIVLFGTPLSAQELTGTLGQIKKTGKIRLGYRESHPPMSFLDDNRKPAGYSIDLCESIVDRVEKKLDADVEVEYVPVSPSAYPCHPSIRHFH